MINNPTDKRIDKMVQVSSVSVYCFYFSVILGGYLSYLDQTPKDILTAI